MYGPDVASDEYIEAEIALEKERKDAAREEDGIYWDSDEWEEDEAQNWDTTYLS